MKNEIEAHLNYRRCFQTHWMALAEARRCQVPCLLVLCPLNGLGFWFGLVCDSISYMLHILQILSAKELKHRQINKLADAGGGNVFCVLHLVFFFFPSISKVCHIWVFDFRRGSSLSDEFWMPPRRKHRVFFWGAGDWSVRKSQRC